MTLKLRFTAHKTHDNPDNLIVAYYRRGVAPSIYLANASPNNRVVIHDGQIKEIDVFSFPVFVGKKSRGSDQYFYLLFYDYDKISSNDYLGTIFTDAQKINGNIDVTWGTGRDTRFFRTGTASGLVSRFIMRGSGTNYELLVSWISSPVFKIQNKHSKKCLDVVNALDQKANVQQWRCKPDSDFVENQRWFFKEHRLPGTPSGAIEKVFVIYNNNSGDVLDIEGGLGDRSESKNVQQYPYHGNNNQSWYILRSREHGFFYILDYRLRALDVEGNSENDNANIQVFPFHGGDNQKWIITPRPAVMTDRAVTGEDFVRKFGRIS